MPRWHVYVNRAAGRTPIDPSRVGDVLTDLGLDAEIVVPGSGEEMAVLIQEAARSGAGHFAVVGGDGTVNQAVNALMPLGLDPRPVLGVLPVGTGCDLLRTFGLPQDLARAARHLTTGDTYDIDIATLEGDWGLRFFVNVAQTGVGAAAAQTARHTFPGTITNLAFEAHPFHRRNASSTRSAPRGGAGWFEL